MQNQKEQELIYKLGQTGHLNWAFPFSKGSLLQAFTINIGRGKNNLSGQKHSSLFLRTIIDEENRFGDVDGKGKEQTDWKWLLNGERDSQQALEQTSFSTREFKMGKYHCTIDLLFDWFRLTCFINKNKTCQLSYCWFQTSQTGGQQYSDTSPL